MRRRSGSTRELKVDTAVLCTPAAARRRPGSAPAPARPAPAAARSAASSGRSSARSAPCALPGLPRLRHHHPRPLPRVLRRRPRPHAPHPHRQDPGRGRGRHADPAVRRGRGRPGRRSGRRPLRRDPRRPHPSSSAQGRRPALLRDGADDRRRARHWAPVLDHQDAGQRARDHRRPRHQARDPVGRRAAAQRPGCPRLRGTGRGDLYVHVDVETPTKPRRPTRRRCSASWRTRGEEFADERVHEAPRSVVQPLPRRVRPR